MTTYAERLAQIERPRSRAALWCQRLAVFAVPFLIIVIGGHRYGIVETQATFWLLGLGGLIAMSSIIAGVRGFYELWTYGHEAGLTATRGVLLATVLLVPFMYQGVKAFSLPPLYDISTDLDDAPEFDSALDDRTDEMNPIVEPVEAIKRIQLQAYPKVAARRYPLDSGRVFREVVGLVGERDWTILTEDTKQGAAPIDDEGSGLVAKPNTDANGLPLRTPLPVRRPLRSTSAAPGDQPPIEAVQVSPVGRAGIASDDVNETSNERYVEAVATSFLFAFESDVVIRIIEEEEGTLVDMRSSSRWGPHDLGSNAQRILSFMADLDLALQGLGQGS